MKVNDYWRFIFLTVLLTAKLNHSLCFFEPKYKNNFLIDLLRKIIIIGPTINPFKSIKFLTATKRLYQDDKTSENTMSAHAKLKLRHALDKLNEIQRTCSSQSSICLRFED